MSCFQPRLAFNAGLDPITHKNRIKFLPIRADYNLERYRSIYGKDLLMIPCGHCIGCVQDYKKEWSIRILLEASLYKENCFITLTFNDENLPSDLRPHLEDLQRFFKRLRKKIGVPIRYFYCGEVGEKKGIRKNGNPHYHAIVFGYDFPDKVFHSLTSKGSEIFTSKLLSSCWPFGFSSIGAVDPGSAMYVASYSTKKKLNNFDDGCFVGMSRRPGLGFDKFNLRWFESDKIYMALGEVSIPRFFCKMLDSINPFFYGLVKEQRLKRINQRIGLQSYHGFLEEEDLIYNENIKLDDFKRRCLRVL